MFKRHLEVLKKVSVFLQTKYKQEWAFGGGTALSLFFWQHRFSEDLDFFLFGPEPFLKKLASKELIRVFEQETGLLLLEKRFPGHVLTFIIKVETFPIKVQFFDEQKVAPLLSETIGNLLVYVEPPEGIIARKIFWKEETFRSRDIFDIACYIEKEGLQKLFSIIPADKFLTFLKNFEEKVKEKGFIDSYQKELTSLNVFKTNKKLDPEYCLNLFQKEFRKYLFQKRSIKGPQI